MPSKLNKFLGYILFKVGLKSKHNAGGGTLFAPLKIQPEYTKIDLERRQVTGIVKYNDKVYLSVMVDVQNNNTKVKGNLREIKKITKPFKKRNYIEVIKSEAEYFIENGIISPKAYYDNR